MLHPKLCSNMECTNLLNKMADKLGKLLDKNYAHLVLTYWLPMYIKLQGKRWLSNFLYQSPAMQQVSNSQDLIPWTSFMEGKLSNEISQLQW